MFVFGKKKEEAPILNKMPLPDGMSPDRAVQLLTARLNAYIKDMRKFACKNAVISAKEPSYDYGTTTIYPGDIIFSDQHCKNQRLRDSQYCESCREKGLAERAAMPPREKIAPPKRVHYSRKKRKQMKAKQSHATHQRK